MPQKERIINGKKYILRKSYKKKGYHRRGYTRKNGVRVKASKVRSTKIKSSWILKRGLTSGKYGLIPLKDDRHLRKFGYKFNKTSGVRHKALRKAVEKYGKTWAIRRLNAIANIHPKIPKYSNLVKKARKDISYVRQI